MNKEETLKALGEAGINTTLTDAGEIRAELLELALAGVSAKGAKADSAKAEEAYLNTIGTLNERIDELEQQKTPDSKSDQAFHKKSKKTYRLKHPSNFHNVKITATVLNENQELFAKLIESGSTILEEIKGV